MDWLLFPEGGLRGFIEYVQEKSGLNFVGLAKLIEVSSRTLRDWKREKYRPSKDSIFKLSQLSGVKLPTYKVVSQQEHMNQIAVTGGRRRLELYGPPGTKEGRSKGGTTSWIRRKNDPELWKKYTKDILYPEESEELAEFIGIMLGDGGMTHFQCVIYLNSETDREYVEYVCHLIKKLFGLKASIYESKKDKVLRISIAGVNLVKYLTLKGLKLGNKVRLQVAVPSWVQARTEYTKACIRGLIDTDGSFFIHKYRVKGQEYSYPRINFTSKSKPIINFAYEGLINLDFNPKKSGENQICLYSQKEVRKYLEVIGANNIKNAINWFLGRVA
ncbi:MAG: hypothetical protein V1808_02170 [Candidatus Daviesbacteria bacterium]